MITKTTGLDNKYSDLFAEVSEKSGGSINVSSIEEYFMNITDIAELDEKFLMLPLDEPMFEIDADARKINIPDEFKANGISVEGDHLAETVFFKIDRYFDYVDLDSKNIRINWKIGGVSGASVNFIKNKDIVPGSIIFGWPIAKEITGKTGSLTFAVQFYDTNLEGTYTYNFNTQTASISIKGGLALQDPEVVNNSDDILNMLVNSVYGEGEAAVDKAVWVSGDGNGLVLNDIDAEFTPIVNLDASIGIDGLPVVVPAYLLGMADAGSDAVIEYRVPNGITVSDDAEEGQIKLVVDHVGDYMATAQGAKFDSNNHKIGSGESTDSAIVTVPAAKPVMAEISASGKSMTDYEVAEGNYAFLNPSAGATLTAVAAPLDGGSADDIGALEFIWMKDGEQIEDDEDLGFTLDTSDSFVVDPADENPEGVYSVKIKHFKNGEYAEDAVSAEFNIAFPADDVPTKPVVSLEDGTEVGTNTIDINPGESVKVIASVGEFNIEDRDPRSESITFVWESSVDKSAWAVAGEGAELVISAESYYRVVAKNNYKGSASIKRSSAFLVNKLNLSE